MFYSTAIHRQPSFTALMRVKWSIKAHHYQLFHKTVHTAI